MINTNKTLFKTLFLGIFTLIAFTNFSFGQDKAEQIEKLLQQYTDYGQFNGSVLVAEKGEVIYKNGFGMANFEWDIANQADTKHRLGSITKQFTAMLILQMVEEGKLDLEATVSKYIPDYSKINGDKITIHHLLTHTSGIPNYTAQSGFMKDLSRDPYKPMDFLSIFADSTLVFTPGSDFQYSNSGYFLLGAIMEQVSGKSYEELLHENIFSPLKMTDSGYDNHNDIIKRRSTGYEKSGKLVENSRYIDMTIPYAAGSMYSTSEDLYLWDQALYTEKILSQKYLDLMFKEHVPAFGQNYAYGWLVGEMPVGTSEKTVSSVGHGGGINGFNTLITRIVEDKSLVVLLSNTGAAPLNEITLAINGILYNEPYKGAKQSLAFVLIDLFRKESIEDAKSFFTENKDTEKYSLDENEMNSSGYEFLQAGDLKIAEEIFKMNMDAFPESFNVYDSYAEALMMQDKKELAIKYYKKSIEMNPTNQNGIDMLKKLGVNTETLIKDIDVPDDVLKSYTGDYELMPGFILSITKEGKQLKAQATGQQAFEIYPKSINVFYVKVITAQITFNENENGSIESLTLFQNGQEIPGKRIEK